VRRSDGVINVQIAGASSGDRDDQQGGDCGDERDTCLKNLLERHEDLFS
jgi:hypothetical protein